MCIEASLDGCFWPGCWTIQIYIAHRSYGEPWNGIGAVDAIRQRQALAPMAYRPLMALLVAVVERALPWMRRDRVLFVYEPLKVGMMAVALLSYHHLLLLSWLAPGWALAGTLLAGLLWTLSWLFDYWGGFVEWAVFSLAAAIWTVPVLLSLAGGQ